MTSFGDQQYKIRDKAHDQGRQDVPPVKVEGEKGLIQAPGQEIQDQNREFGEPDRLLHGIKEECGGRDRHDIADGIGQMPVIDMIRIDDRPIEVGQQPAKQETQDGAEQEEEPPSSTLFNRRIQNEPFHLSIFTSFRVKTNALWAGLWDYGFF